MFTPSIVLLMIVNTVTASGAVLVALQASAFETGRVAWPALTADAADIANAGLSRQQSEVADAA
jgi:hypothetical protein